MLVCGQLREHSDPDERTGRFLQASGSRDDPSPVLRALGIKLAQEKGAHGAVP